MKSHSLLFLLGVCGATFASAADTHLGISLRIGAPPPVIVREAPPPPVVVEHETRSAPPGPGYVWIPHHRVWANGRWAHVPGAWVLPPQPGARWVEGQWDPQTRQWTEEHWEVTTTTSYPSYPAAPTSPPPAVQYAEPGPDYGYANGEAEVVFESAPPPMRQEIIPPRPSRDHVWVAGYWTVNRGRHEWQPGRWEIPPRGRSVWVAPRWEQRGHSYVMTRGYWR